MIINNFFTSRGLGSYSIVIGGEQSGKYCRQVFSAKPNDQIHIYGDGHSANYLEEEFRSAGINVERHSSICGLFMMVR